MGAFRTPDERFEGLSGWPYAPRYAVQEGLRMHYVEEGAGNPILLLHGEPADEAGSVRQRYLKVSKSLIPVSDREYQLCIARGRGPYLDEAAFTELRKGVAAELSAPPPPAMKTPERTEPPPVASPKKEAPREPPAPGRSYGGVVALLAVVAAVAAIFIRRPKSPRT